VGGIFREFVNNIYSYYSTTYGIDSQQVKDCSNGYFFEPSVSEKILNEMVNEEKRIKVYFHRTPVKTMVYKNRLFAVDFTRRKSDEIERINAGIIIDATYEGDIAAMAGVPYRVGRESRDEFGEAYGGVLYLDHLTRMVLPGSTGEGDKRIQAYNFRLCLTKDPNNRVISGKPDNYNRKEYLQVLESIKNGRIKRVDDVLNIEKIPNGKSDTNNMPLSLISTDLPEENYAYPEADYQKREKIIKRHKDYILGLIYFLQNDDDMPEKLRNECKEWGFAKDEFVDNNNFPRQIYVREARRIWGLYTFSAHDAILSPSLLRTPIHFDSIACGGYNIDSHAVKKKEPGQDAELEGFFWLSGITQPYQIPYRIMIPQNIDGLIVPGAVSATHLGFGTLRMEPVWMAMGQAAGIAAHIAEKLFLKPRDIPVNRLQAFLVANNQVLTTFNDIQGPNADVSEDAWDAIQFFGTRGFFESYDVKPIELITRGQAAKWLMSCIKLGDFMPSYGPFVKHNGGGNDESSLAQLEKLKIIPQAGDANVNLTESELNLWLKNIEPWLDGALGDKWVHRVKPKEEIGILIDESEPVIPVTRIHFCDQLFKRFRGSTPVEIDKNYYKAFEKIKNGERDEN
ncbi:MAG: FAD-dependent oxidoreductase, partial [Armatimonadota bacterium]